MIFLNTCKKNLTWNYVGIGDYFEVGFLKGRGVRKTKQKWYTVQTWLSQTLKKDKLLIFCDFFFVWWFFFSFSYFCTKELLFPLHLTRKLKEKHRPWAKTRGQKFDFCIAASWLFSYFFVTFFHGGQNDFFFFEVEIKPSTFWSFKLTNEFLC